MWFCKDNQVKTPDVGDPSTDVRTTFACLSAPQLKTPILTPSCLAGHTIQRLMDNSAHIPSHTEKSIMMSKQTYLCIRSAALFLLCEGDYPHYPHFGLLPAFKHCSNQSNTLDQNHFITKVCCAGALSTSKTNKQKLYVPSVFIPALSLQRLKNFLMMVLSGSRMAWGHLLLTAARIE